MCWRAMCTGRSKSGTSRNKKNGAASKIATAASIRRGHGIARMAAMLSGGSPGAVMVRFPPSRLDEGQPFGHPPIDKALARPLMDRPLDRQVKNRGNAESCRKGEDAAGQAMA